jgi:hypothetical protein
VSGGEQQQTDAKENSYDGHSGGPESDEMGQRTKLILGHSGHSLNPGSNKAICCRQHGRAKLVNTNAAFWLPLTEPLVE